MSALGTTTPSACSAKGDLFGLTLYGELAWQDKAGVLGDDDAIYAHVTATKNLKTRQL